jgi:hypothetical protein
MGTNWPRPRDSVGYQETRAEAVSTCGGGGSPTASRAECLQCCVAPATADGYEGEARPRRDRIARASHFDLDPGAVNRDLGAQIPPRQRPISCNASVAIGPGLRSGFDAISRVEDRLYFSEATS